MLSANLISNAVGKNRHRSVMIGAVKLFRVAFQAADYRF